MLPDNTPIIVAVANKTFLDVENYKRTPIDALNEVSHLAFLDSGCAAQLKGCIDAIITVKFAMGMSAEIRKVLAPYAPGATLAALWGLRDCHYYTSTDGGNAPQFLINHFAELLNRGIHKTVIINACELNATIASALKKKVNLSHWSESPQNFTVESIGEGSYGCSDIELKYGLFPPVNAFSLIESSIRHQSGSSVGAHQEKLARICSRLSNTAARNPNAWCRNPLTVEQIISPDNRYIAHPYTKSMCARMNVNMAAAVVMTTVGNAKRLNIHKENWIFLNGCADVCDSLYLSERPVLHESRALNIAVREALLMAAVKQEFIKYYDIYTCFPAALEVSCRELNIDPLKRDTTLTGGLPYYGGPGSGYTLHGVAHMVHTLRHDPGSYGLVIAHGWYLSKESVGVYSTIPSGYEWERKSLAEIQSYINKGSMPKLIDGQTGKGFVEAYTVEFDHTGPKKGVILGSMKEGMRFLANVEEKHFEVMLTEDIVGLNGVVYQIDNKNFFSFK